MINAITKEHRVPQKNVKTVLSKHKSRNSKFLAMFASSVLIKELT